MGGVEQGLIDDVYARLVPCMADDGLAKTILQEFGNKCFLAKKRLTKPIKREESNGMEYIVSVSYKSGRVEKKAFPSIKNKKYLDYIRDCAAAKDMGVITDYSTAELR